MLGQRRWVVAAVGIAVLLGIAPVARAVPVVLSDPYAGQNATGSGAASQASDVIGRYADFDVHSITITQLTLGLTTLRIRQNFHSGDATLADWTAFGQTMRVGDLLITANGNQYGVALVSHDGFDAGDLYSTTGRRTSDSYLNGSGLYWRFNTAVRMDPSGSAHLGTGTSSTVGVGGNEVETTLSFVTGDQLWNDFSTAGIMTLQFASAICANDIVVGTVSRVPEPGLLLLTGAGLILVGMLAGPRTSAARVRRSPKQTPPPSQR